MVTAEAQWTRQAAMVAELSIDRLEAPQDIQQTVWNFKGAARHMSRQDMEPSG